MAIQSMTLDNIKAHLKPLVWEPYFTEGFKSIDSMCGEYLIKAKPEGFSLNHYPGPYAHSDSKFLPFATLEEAQSAAQERYAQKVAELFNTEVDPYAEDGEEKLIPMPPDEDFTCERYVVYNIGGYPWPQTASEFAAESRQLAAWRRPRQSWKELYRMGFRLRKAQITVKLLS